MIEYTLIRSRRRTVVLQITPQGRVVVRAPEFAPKAQIDDFVESKKDWILQKLNSIRFFPPPLTEAELKDLAKLAKEDIPQRCQSLAQQMGVSYNRITIRTQRTRWGSCSIRGNLNFNCLLMLTAPEIRNYVVAHELCHLLEMNHSPRFWAEVKRLIPDYKLRRKWLKENGAALMARIPEE